jgi:4-hydroxy-4-methyl-2-oxoglutarate aldolase
MADRRPAHRAPRPGRVSAVLSGLSSAAITTAVGDRARIVRGLDPAWPGAAALGPAVTVRAHGGDNLAVHLAVARAAAGSVIVVDAGGEQEVAFAGDLVVRAAARRAVAGIVIDGAIRDRAEIAGMRFPVFHRGTSPRGPTKRLPGGVQVPIELCGVPVSPGDLVCVDDDGLVVVRAADTAAVLDEARALEAREAAFRTRVESGEPTLKIFGIEDPSRDD